MRPPHIPQTVPIRDDDAPNIKTMKQLYNALIEFREVGTNRIVIQLFISLPSRKHFPDYFDVVKKPISMYEIRKRIETNQYSAVESCINDFKLMFNNCRVFNEDNSQIYRDAVTLEDFLLKKYKQLQGIGNNGTNGRQAVHHETPKDTPKKLATDNGISNSRSSSANITSDTPKKLATTDNGNSRRTSLATPNNNSTPGQLLQKKRLLTGYIIYAAEVRKEYVDKHPNQDFGFISRLIGNDWRTLDRALRTRYEERAAIANQKFKERMLLQAAQQADNVQQPHVDGPKTSTPKRASSPKLLSAPKTPASQRISSQLKTSEAATQTAPIRFVEPPTKRSRYTHSENFRHYIESLEVPNKDLLAEELQTEKPSDPVTKCLGTGLGRHKTPEAALWALRDFMLQDADTMRWSLQPYLCHETTAGNDTVKATTTKAPTTTETTHK